MLQTLHPEQKQIGAECLRQPQQLYHTGTQQTYQPNADVVSKHLHVLDSSSLGELRHSLLAWSDECWCPKDTVGCQQNLQRSRLLKTVLVSVELALDAELAL